jgi:hypothetical protein
MARIVIDGLWETYHGKLFFFENRTFGFPHKTPKQVAIKVLRGGSMSKPSFSEKLNQARTISHAM